MAASTFAPKERLHTSAVPWIAGFLTYIAFLALDSYIPLPVPAKYTLRVIVVSAVMLALARPAVPRSVSNPLGSILLGIGVFVIWVGPDVLWPGYRNLPLFNNSIVGKAASSLPADAALKSSVYFMIIRSLGSFLLVPVLEELFWRGWLMRWLIDKDFWKVPMGKYAPGAFWMTAALFASEHGPYWDVGLAAGVLYNWWLVRTKSLGDCILAHAVTNAVLAWYVLTTGNWQYWL